MVFTAGKKAQYTGWLLNIVNSQNFAPLPQQHWTAIGCTENGKPLGVTVHSKNELLSYMQRTGWSELGKTHFLMNTLYLSSPFSSMYWLRSQYKSVYMKRCVEDKFSPDCNLSGNEPKMKRKRNLYKTR